MPEAKNCRAGLRDGQHLSSDQPEPEASLSTRGAESTCRPNDDSSTEGNRVAQGTLSASCPGLLQSAQNDTAPEGIDPGSCQIPPGSEANGSLGPRLDAQSSLHIPGTSSSGKLKVRLCNHALWLQFFRQQTEMKLDKKGRNMFPFLVYKIQGMDPSALYHVFVEVEPVDKHPWKYQRGKWLPLKDKKEEDNLPGNRFYQHPDSPNTGAHWMDREIAFKNLKLANKETACKNGSQAPILLKSLHKYQPRLHIEEVSDASFSRHNFTFPDTEFITVTAYQNPGIRRLKIQNNPFASGFRRKPSCPGESLQKSPPAGECSGSTSSPTALLVSNYPLQVQQGPGQEKDCDFMCGSQSPSGQLYETSDSRSTTSLVLPLTGEGLNPDLLPCTSQNDVSYHPSTDTPITQGNWSCSLSNCTSNENGMECFNSPNAMPQKTGTQSEEEERLQDQLFSSSYSNLSDVSNLGQRPSKKRCLSPVDSDKYSSTSAWKTREQEKGLGASESSGNNFHEAVAEGSCYPVVLQEDTDQTKEMMNPTSGNSIQETQSPSELPSDSIDLVLHAALCELFPDNYPPAMANDPRPDANITQGNWSCFLSNSTSNGNSTDCLPSESPKPQQASTGTEEEERLQEQFCLSSIRSLSDVSPLEQRPSKKRCLTPVNSAKDSSTSAWKTRGQEKKLLPSESNGSSIHEAVAEGSCYPVVLQEDTDQTKGMMNPTPGNSIQETQPLSELPSDSTALDLHTVLCEILPAIYSPAMPPDPSPDTHITEGNWPHSLSNCTSIGNGMECFQSVNAKPQQASTGTEEEERLQEQFCLSSIRSLSDDSPLEQRPSKERCLTPVNSAKDSSTSAWKIRGQEKKLLPSESNGSSIHEAVAEGSCYPVVLQEDTDQTKGMKNPTPGNSIQETQPLSELPSDSTVLDLHAVLCEILPAIYSPAMPPDPSPDMHMTEGSWPHSLSNCTSIGNGMECFQSVNAKPQQACTGTEEEERLQEQFCLSRIRSLSDDSPLEQRPSKERCLTPVNSAKDSSAPAWKAIEQEDKYLGASESSGNNFHEAVAEGSCYPVVLQEDTDQTKGMMNPTPGNSIQETQPLSELPSDSTALDLHAVLCEIFPAIYSPVMPPDPSPDTHITEGNWPRSLSNCTSIGNGMECFQSVNAKPQQASTGTEEEERLQEQFCLSTIRSLSDVSPLEQRPSKERCLTPVNSAKDSSAPAWKAIEQEDKYLGASESSGNNFHEAVAEGSCYPVVLQEDTDQTKGMMNPTPGNSVQETQSPLELPSDSTALDLHTVLCEILPAIYSPAMPPDPSPDTHITEGNCSRSLSNCTSIGNGMECFQSVNAKPQQSSTGTEEEERLQEQFCLSSIRSLSDDSPLEQRPSKERCLTPVNSAKDSSTSAWKIRGQEKKLLPSESNGSSIHEAVAEGSCYPVVLQEDTDQTKGMKNPTPGNSIQETQPLSELPSDSTALDLHAVLCEILPAIYSPAIPPDPSPDMHMTEGNCPRSLSNCTSIGNGMECFQSVNAKPQQSSTGTEEEERLQEQFCLSSISISDVSPLEQRPSKERCLTSVNSAKDSSALAWETRELEDKRFIVRESSSNSTQEAVSEGSCYPVVLQEDTGQAKEKMNPTPWDSVLENHTLSDLSFDSTLYDMIHQFFPSFSQPAMPYYTSPDTPITSGNWPPPVSPFTSNGIHMDFCQSGIPKHQQEDTVTEEEEGLQEQL